MLRQCSMAFADMSAPTHDFKQGASFKSIIPLPQPSSNTLALHSSPAARAAWLKHSSTVRVTHSSMTALVCNSVPLSDNEFR